MVVQFLGKVARLCLSLNSRCLICTSQPGSNSGGGISARDTLWSQIPATCCHWHPWRQLGINHYELNPRAPKIFLTHWHLLIFYSWVGQSRNSKTLPTSYTQNGGWCIAEKSAFTSPSCSLQSHFGTCPLCFEIFWVIVTQASQHSYPIFKICGHALCLAL